MQFKDYVTLTNYVLPGYPIANDTVYDALPVYEDIQVELKKLPEPKDDFETFDRFALRATTEGQIHNYKVVGHSVWEE